MKRQLIELIQRSLLKRNFVVARPSVPCERPLNLLKLLVDRASTDRPLNILQIGANDGVHNDPIHGLLMAHPDWKALLVEPQPDVFERLTQHYAEHPGVRCANCAVASSDGAVALYRFSPDMGYPDEISGLASFDRQMLLRYRKHYPGIERTLVRIQVPARTVESLCAHYNMAAIDVLQIDVEGYDYQVLKMAFDANLRPSVINFESWHLSVTEKRLAAELLTRNKYSYCTVDRDTTAASDYLI